MPCIVIKLQTMLQWRLWHKKDKSSVAQCPLAATQASRVPIYAGIQPDSRRQKDDQARIIEEIASFRKDVGTTLSLGCSQNDKLMLAHSPLHIKGLTATC